MSSSWFSCWPSSSPLALSYRLNSFKVMVPLRNNHLYWFSPQHLFLSDELWTSYLILQTAAPVALCSVCHFMPPLSSLFLLFLLMHYSLLTFALEVQFDWHFAAEWSDRESDDRLAVERRPVSCSSLFASACCPRWARLAKTQRKSSSMLSAPAHCPELCATVRLQTRHWLFPFTLELIIWNELGCWYKSRGPAAERKLTCPVKINVVQKEMLTQEKPHWAFTVI